MIDLHAHTDRSDGTFTPAELVAEAVRVGLTALAITDHDTFAGYDAVVRNCLRTGLNCLRHRATTRVSASVHLLGYFSGHSCSRANSLLFVA